MKSTAREDNLQRGIVFMLMATVSFAVADACGKLLAQHYPFMQVIWLRSAFGVLLILAAIGASGQWAQVKTRYPHWHIGRSLVGILMTTGIFTGLKYIPLAEVTAIVFATPFMVALYSSWFLKERVSMATYGAIIAGFLGVLVVARPTPEHFHFAHLSVLGFAAASSFLIITARKLAGKESVLTLNLYIYPATLLFSSWWAFQDWLFPSALDWLLFFAVSLFATLALYCVTQAMHCARPAQVAPIDYFRIMWTVVLGFMFWGELPDGITWLGILLIVGSGIYVVKHGRSMPESGVEQLPLKK